MARIYNPILESPRFSQILLDVLSAVILLSPLRYFDRDNTV
jgi:hypothetical protein